MHGYAYNLQDTDFQYLPKSICGEACVLHWHTSEYQIAMKIFICIMQPTSWYISCHGQHYENKLLSEMEKDKLSRPVGDMV